MLAKTQEFLSEFKEQGFGFVEGSKWSSYTTREQFTQEDLYMTPDQILKEECFNEANAQAKIKNAEALGEGVNEPGKRKGWYRDESRHNAPVYYYARNMVHAIKLREDKSHMTRQSTGNMAIQGNGVLSLPSEPGTVPKALCVGQRCGSAKTGPRPKVLKVATSDTGTGGQPNTESACTEQTNTKDSEAPEANTSPEDLAAHAREVCISTEVDTAYAKEPDVAELDTQALDEDSAEKTVPLKPIRRSTF